jgi:lysophospholipase L1-like esterase
VQKLTDPRKSVLRLTYIALMNLLVLTVLFAIIELSYRVYTDGFSGAFVTLANYVRETPYSNLGTGNWVVSDEILGYRLNPRRSGVNSLSVRHGEIVVPKPQNLYRVIYLGDSIPYDDPGFVSYTREMLSTEGSLEVINAGVPGYTTYQELAFFKNYLLQTEPDLVLLTYCLNDNHTFLHRFDQNARMLLTAEAIESLKVNGFADKIISRSYVLSKLKLGILARQRQSTECAFPWDCAYDFHIAWKDEPWAQFDGYLSELKALVHARRGKFAVIIVPYEPQLDLFKRVSDSQYVLKPQIKLRNLCEKHALPCLDLFTAFRTKSEEGIRLFRDGIHLNEEGHRLAAETIYTFLHEQDLLSAANPPVPAKRAPERRSRT